MKNTGLAHLYITFVITQLDWVIQFFSYWIPLSHCHSQGNDRGG
jgi:hypothetical protein